MFKRIALASTVLLSVASCSGGGSSDSASRGPAGTPTDPLPFEGFSKLEVGKTTQLLGASNIIAITDNGDGTLSVTGPERKIASAYITPAGVGYGTLVLKQDGQPDLVLDAEATYSNFFNGSILAVSADGTGLALYADETKNGHEYQTYGTWLNVPAGNKAYANAASFGRKTQPSEMPASTSATYNGNSLGVFVAENGFVGMTDSRVKVTTDFKAARMSSLNTYVTDLQSGATAPAGDLDFAVTVDDVKNGSGTGTIVTPIQTGTASIEFYGPNAEEVGGNFQTSGTISDVKFRYGGAYGGKR